MRSEERRFSDGAGDSVSGLVTYPDDAAYKSLSVVLAHGAGSNMRTPLLALLQRRLAEAGYVSACFNFPYTERGRRLPDRAPVLETCYRSVLRSLRDELGMTRLVIGGKSMGGRMATHLAAAGEPVAGVLLYGYPLHPAQRPDKLRVEHLPRVTVPMLFFSGTRDELCTLDLLRAALTTLRAPATVHVIEDGDHSFVVRKSRTGRSQGDVQHEIAATTIEWLRRLPEH